MALENKVDYTIERDTVERMFGKPMTDNQWVVFASEMEDELDRFFFEVTPGLLGIIDHLVEQDSKFDEEAI